MPLHNTEDLKAGPTSQLESEVLNEKTDSYEFPEAQQDPRTVYQTIHNQLILDGNSQQNLATFCTTWIEPEVRQLMEESADKNMIDKDEYPQTAAIEERCVHMLADLWNSPEAASTIGCSTTGSSEAAWPSNGNGANVRAPRANQPLLRTSSWARSRSAGTNSAATSTSRSAKFPWRASACC